MNNRMKCDEYSIANNLPGVDSRRVFNFLNRVFDSMKMHTAAQKVYITGEHAGKEKGRAEVRKGESDSEPEPEIIPAVQNA